MLLDTPFCIRQDLVGRAVGSGVDRAGVLFDIHDMAVPFLDVNALEVARHGAADEGAGDDGDNADEEGGDLETSHGWYPSFGCTLLCLFVWA